METNPIIQAAEKIIAARIAASLEKEREAERKWREREQKLLYQFEEAFSEHLPLLRLSDISWTAHFHSEYEHQGSYIQFEHGGRILKMDFSNATSYRYLYSTPADAGCYHKMTYGKWLDMGTDDFILFLYEGLFRQPEENEKFAKTLTELAEDEEL